MSNMFVVRHCEPALTGVVLGRCDPPLSERGIAHAATLLAGIEFAVVYSSPLKRAIETATAIARGARIIVIDDLREISYGEWDGRTWADIEAADPHLSARKLEDWPGVTPPGGEAWNHFAARVTQAMRLIVEGPKPAAIVAHAAVNRMLTGVDQTYGDIHEL